MVLGAVMAIVPPESNSFIVFTDGTDTNVVLKVQNIPLIYIQKKIIKTNNLIPNCLQDLSVF